jgi:hypothetical protein|tara:strand:+ start:1226 stop:1564 length:339 start_codon:yes stop_codon:yes gene_type:complete
MSDIKDKYKFVLRKVKDLEEGATEYEKDTFIGLTEEAGRYAGIIYKYGKVSIPDENQLDPKGDLPFKFEYDIVDDVNMDQEYFKEDFFNLIGDILVDIITTESDEEPKLDNN